MVGRAAVGVRELDVQAVEDGGHDVGHVVELVAATAGAHALIVQFGLNKPDYVQYFSLLWNALHFNFGISPSLQEPVKAAISQRIGTTGKLAALDLVLLTLGTGIGGGIISGGRILRGYLGMAGELGHITVVPNGYPCGCGSQGCVEKYSSATAVSAMARRCAGK